MDTNTQKRALLIVGLLVTLALVLLLQKPPETSDKVGVRLELPAIVGDYRGKSCLFCQNQLCERSLSPIDNNGENVCPQCGSELGAMSIAEKTLLPSDTIIVKRRYRNDLGEEVFAMIVATGKERKSIHRPETCLPAQGYSIEGSRTIPVSIPSRNPLPIMLLDLRTSQTKLSGTGSDHYSAYAYWFVSPNSETPHHFQRMLQMSMDCIFKGINYRWAYIVIATDRHEGSEDYVKRLSNFIADLYPLISPHSLPAMSSPTP